MNEIRNAKKIIIDYIDDVTIVKTTKWVYKIKNDIGEYIEMDAGYSKKEIELMQSIQDIYHKDWLKLRELLEELI